LSFKAKTSPTDSTSFVTSARRRAGSGSTDKSGMPTLVATA